MAALVLVEHDHHSLKAATHHAVSAAKQCSPNVDLLLIGSNAGSISQAAACIAGVRKVLYAMRNTLRINFQKSWHNR